MQEIAMTLTSLFAAFQQSRKRQATIRDLKRLSDEQLLDVGIEPDHLEETAAAMLRGETQASARSPAARAMRRRVSAGESRWRIA
jgi:uncharacterized protein YjiS (DUF1127 family)